MSDDLAASNVNRTYSLAGMSLAIFTFLLIFLYPRYVAGEVDPTPFQVTLSVMGVATFSLVFAAFHYYAASLGRWMDESERARFARRGDRFWLAGYTLLFLAPSLVLLCVGLLPVGAVWFGLWVAYIAFAIRTYPRVETQRESGDVAAS
jgi:hypothetical protein